MPCAEPLSQSKRLLWEREVGGRDYIEVLIVGEELAVKVEALELRGDYVKVRGVVKQNGSPLRPPAPKPRYMRITVTAASQFELGDEMVVVGPASK